MTTRSIVLAVTALAVAAGIGVWLTLGGNESPSADASPSPSPSVPLRTATVPAPSAGTIEDVEPSQKADAKTPSRKPVKADLDEVAELSDGVDVKLDDLRVESIDAVGPGEVGGRAVIAQIDITNGSDETLDLTRVWTQLERAGQVLTPQTGGPYQPFTGTLAPGKSSTGTQVFALGSVEPTRLSLLVDLGPGLPRALFSGDL